MVFLLSPPPFFPSSSFSPSLKRRSGFNPTPAATRRSGPAVRAALITSSDSFEVGRLVGSYGFINVTSYSGLQPETDFANSFGEVGQLKVQDVGEESVKISFEVEQSVKHRKQFVIRLLRGAMKGPAYMHDHDRLHQSLGPSSVVLNTIVERDAVYLIPRLRDLAFSVDIRHSYLEDGRDELSEGLWKRASSAGAFTTLEKQLLE